MYYILVIDVHSDSNSRPAMQITSSISSRHATVMVYKKSYALNYPSPFRNRQVIHIYLNTEVRKNNCLFLIYTLQEACNFLNILACMMTQRDLKDHINFSETGKLSKEFKLKLQMIFHTHTFKCMVCFLSLF